ncbi:uncharacterized protein LOC118241282 [Electrophorus electricus]|uniref:uncharacterized protein LOC118241282 n=1 Tax=Electrophorus electricus TaxID=8005 RepID=UPI0015CFFAA5|nr:uncharacterized protein LOC118241282 [Electrophorus electricus]
MESFIQHSETGGRGLVSIRDTIWDETTKIQEYTRIMAPSDGWRHPPDAGYWTPPRAEPIDDSKTSGGTRRRIREGDWGVGGLLPLFYSCEGQQQISMVGGHPALCGLRGTECVLVLIALVTVLPNNSAEDGSLTSAINNLHELSKELHNNAGVNNWGNNIILAVVPFCIALTICSCCVILCIRRWILRRVDKPVSYQVVVVSQQKPPLDATPDLYPTSNWVPPFPGKLDDDLKDHSRVEIIAP